MGDRLRSCVEVPVWVISLAISLMLAASGFVVNLSVKVGQANQIITDTKARVENKVDREQYNRDNDRIYKALDRIEGKLDQIKR
jgi:hypothetical protein